VSGSVNRRCRSAAGVGRCTPKPASVRGNGRVPSHEGGEVPGAGAGYDDSLGVGAGLVEVGLAGAGLDGLVVAECTAVVGCALGVPPHAASATARTAITTSLRTSRA
jgi:hypothetical protein